MTGIEQMRRCVRWANTEDEIWFDRATPSGVMSSWHTLLGSGHSDLRSFFADERVPPESKRLVRSHLGMA